MKLLKNKMSNKRLFFSSFIFIQIIFKDSAKLCTWLAEKVFKKEMNKSMIFPAFQKSEYTLKPAIVNGKPAEKCPQMSFAARENYKDISLTRNSNKPQYASPFNHRLKSQLIFTKHLTNQLESPSELFKRSLV